MIEDIDVVPVGREADGGEEEPLRPPPGVPTDPDADWRSDFRSYLDDPA